MLGIMQLGFDLLIKGQQGLSITQNLKCQNNQNTINILLSYVLTKTNYRRTDIGISIVAQQVKRLIMPESYIGMQGQKWEEENSQSARAQPPTGKTRVEFLHPGFSLAHTPLLWQTGGRNQQMENQLLCFPLCHSAFQL